ncbi:hypothetical protein NDR87_05655 [Nocardia sp. CDC159]|uniref:Uncharacterized protein n=1 Tax=Nocardia pulmonis TaxID=2951408 RepID=A0A9X2IWI1_9NOCA|nr:MULTISPECIES: hypothetical protein [Nocardia]MCM6772855.1 hypothetical protein [Nocardia pulmonis]MCM6785842.1 hypothetical protein [Nocardia sp. CDC159]
MTRSVIVAGAIALILLVELAALGDQRALLPVLTGVPLTGGLALLLWSLAERARHVERDDSADNEIDNGPAEMLRRWRARAQMLAERADGSRADWDRHLRPLLAKEFELSSGHRIARDRRAIESAGIMQFGPELWPWVDPANSALRDQRNRAPGRAALDEILRRLQSM